MRCWQKCWRRRRNVADPNPWLDESSVKLLDFLLGGFISVIVVAVGGLVVLACW
jgi:hypothetical protein